MLDPPDPPPATQTEGEASTEGAGEGFLSAGQLLGERYQVRRLLGAGGMGEVWQAFDLKLQVEVALKALRADLFADDRRTEGLRREVRAAREVVSPNVCRIFDLEEVAGHELVSMEHVDGQTLLEVLKGRGPLELKEAQDIASQLLAGLEAIHSAGLVHRDIKPENIMLTRTGRVVVMDFGIARGQEEGAGTVSGTPAYMSPEQGRGGAVDARSDLYAAGVVLAEMVSPEGVKDRDSRESLWEGVRQDPPRIADTPWAPVLKRAIAHDPEQRYSSAHTLTRALEEVTLRVEGAEDLNPYPGLASFTEEDAEYFFGREAEVEQMWRRLEGPARLLALVGPSGAGKSSFLRAGLIPNAGATWGIVRCTPGDAALASLRRAVIPELAGDVEALEQLAAGDEDATVGAFTRWRRRHDNALLIVDQFEELFTQNTEDDQGRVASVLSRLVLEADTHVLLGMRDDFLYRCHEHEELSPITSGLTLLGPPVGAALRRAVVQPAAKCGYRFEDEDLVDEMLAEVEGERGALPLLAFAMARLWERRDRQEGLLTREAYGQVGGVEGALAQHAEQTLEEIGTDRLPTVRELFRNLVTAERTRAVRGWDELLSVFEDRENAKDVLRALIDARLLTSYEVEDEEGNAHRRVEIVHESLLASWPRLVRWQTQDADAAQLRDQLRQAARTWEEHDRSDDMLWTGAAYREFAVWREGYPGGLTETEEAFADAMTAHAERSRRRRRIAVAAAFVALLVVFGVVGASRQQAVAEARRAEAAKLLALAQVQIDTDPTEALAFATSSLELSDTHEGRVFVTRALWAGPTVRALNVTEAGYGGQYPLPVFSPNGRWLALAGWLNGYVLVWHEGGGPPIVLGGHAESTDGTIDCGWTQEGLLVTGHYTEGRIRIWAMPGGRKVRELELGRASYWQIGYTDIFFKSLVETTSRTGRPVRRLRLRSWKPPDGELGDLGDVDWQGVFDPSGGSWVYARGDSVFSRPLPIQSGVPDTPISQLSGNASVGSWWRPEGIFSTDSNGGVVLWTKPDGTSVPGRRLRTPETAKTRLMPDAGGRWAVDWAPNTGQRGGKMLLWDLDGMAGVRPIELRRSGGWHFSMTDFHPAGDWVVASTHDNSELSFWPLGENLPTVVEGYDTFSLVPVGFTQDGRYLVTNWGQDRVRLWPLPGGRDPDIVDVLLPRAYPVRAGFAVDPTGRRILSAGYGETIFLLSSQGEDPLHLTGFSQYDLVEQGAFSPSGHLVAAASAASESQPTLRVWDVETGAVLVFDLPQRTEGSSADGVASGAMVQNLVFADETTLYTSGGNGLLRWDLETGSYEQITRTTPGAILLMSASTDRRKILTYEAADRNSRGQLELRDLVTGHVRRVQIPGGSAVVSLGPKGTTWATGEKDGLIWVGRFDGGEPHVLAGHQGPIASIAISPDRKWIASTGEDKTLRLWPMPDLDRPPLHTLPRQELIAKLKVLTNLRVVRDEESSDGWTTKLDPFPGWETVPEW